MRYSVIAKGITPTQAEAEIRKLGITDFKPARLLGQFFCELSEEKIRALSAVSGIVLKPVKDYKAEQVLSEVAPVESLSDVFYLLRSYFNPPLTGTGLTVAVLDSGIRKTHQSLRSKVVYEANFTDSPTADDVFGHGTQVAFIIAGGMHAMGEKAGVSPSASIMNIKVINDDGIGSDEGIVMGIERVCGLAEQARKNGLWITDDLYPNIINLSLGGEDDGDADNPVRAACRKASTEYGLDVIAAAGNSGPKMTTVMLPACDPEVIAVGAVETNGELAIWEKSSRGPTVQGETKPDFVIWGTDLEMASHQKDDEYLVKSGTSFAAPMLSGLAGLLWESGRRAYGEAWVFSWREAKKLAPYFSTKPQDAPVNKDNVYGFGLPAMGSMLGQVSQTDSTTQQGTEVFPMFMMMAMMASMVGA
ncbi:S8 family serine peptidase [Dehalococcoides mccartyi]|uniref:S8 family serine peptidase n=1 Tax=Dehalococcoides mccartyi TaxID=61435 RepID=UPI0019EDB42B|nr:S8 family serine peptidase [Dehalococcoides mccartyi]MBF4481834.1 S8 family serine peptidase [Dehalococcoides mccartyi]MBJ7531164.1 S8 family serine peptidase [Dehalococcoides mccartyi]